MKEAFIQEEYNVEYLKLVEDRITEKGNEVMKKFKKFIAQEDDEERHYDIYIILSAGYKSV